MGFLETLAYITGLLVVAFGVSRGILQVVGDPNLTEKARVLWSAAGAVASLLVIGGVYLGTVKLTKDQFDTTTQEERKKSAERIKDFEIQIEQLKQDHARREMAWQTKESELRDNITAVETNNTTLKVEKARLEERIRKLMEPEHVARVEKANVALKERYKKLDQRNKELNSRLSRYEKKDARVTVSTDTPGARIFLDGEDLQVGSVLNHAVPRVKHWVGVRIPPVEPDSAFYYDHNEQAQSDVTADWRRLGVGLKRKVGTLKLSAYDGQTGQLLVGRSVQVTISPLPIVAPSGFVYSHDEPGRAVVISGGVEFLRVPSGIYQIIAPAGSVPRRGIVTLVDAGEFMLTVY